MHVLHSLAHRAPPATRRVRWQPYTSGSVSSSSASSRSSPTPSSYLNTPNSSVPSSPDPEIQPSHDVDRTRQISSLAAPHSKELLPKDPNRSKHAASLVDQAVKSLCEIWRPQDIPPVFVASARTMITGGSSCDSISSVLQKSSTRNCGRGSHQLPSPISPSTHPSPLPSVTTSPPTFQCSSDSDSPTASNSRGNLVPIRAFVHEVLRRSRTSGCVLQTALCYLEAIRPRVPELVQQEKAGVGVKGEADISDRITPATEAEIEYETEFSAQYGCPMKIANSCEDDTMATIRVYDEHQDSNIIGPILLPKEDSMPGHEAHQRLPPCPSLPPLPPLPSPLLCPRRAFLASLILASKFTQDKCYSNRAWAKLSGLPPREIGRCERALGEALEWRLWVGKQSATSQPSSTPTRRPVVRSQSEGSLFATPSFLPTDKKLDVSLPSPPVSVSQGLRRCATLPADMYGLAPAPPMAGSQFLPNLASTSQWDTLQDKTPLAKTVESCAPTLGYSQYTERISQSPSPETPGLTYSPSSTESCSGDRTVQTSSFLDDPLGTFIPGFPGPNNPDSWLWSDSSDVPSCLPKTPHVTMPPLAGYANAPPLKVPPHDLAIMGSWVVENDFRRQTVSIP